MHLFLRKISYILFYSVIITCFILPANAYVLQGPHILELMIQKIGNPKRLHVEQKLLIHCSTLDIQTDVVELTETLSYAFPENFRSDILSEDTHKIHVVSTGESVTIMDKKISSTSETEYDYYKDILLYRSRTLLNQRLLLIGVDTSVSSLGRFQGKIVYVIGANYPDDSVSQLWIEKDSFIPLRWIIINQTEGNGVESFELRYNNWRKSGRALYPMQIECFQGQNLVRSILVESIKPAPLFPENFFDIAYLKSIYPPLAPDINEYNDLDEIQKTLEDFNKIFE